VADGACAVHSFVGLAPGRPSASTWSGVYEATRPFPAHALNIYSFSSPTANLDGWVDKTRAQRQPRRHRARAPTAGSTSLVHRTVRTATEPLEQFGFGTATQVLAGAGRDDSPNLVRASSRPGSESSRPGRARDAHRALVNGVAAARAVPPVSRRPRAVPQPGRTDESRCNPLHWPRLRRARHRRTGFETGRLSICTHACALRTRGTRRRQARRAPTASPL